MNRIESLIASPLGAIVARPWFDAFTSRFLENWMLPASRLWAAANTAHGSSEEFFRHVPMPPVPEMSARVNALLTRFERVKNDVLLIDAKWDDTFFKDLENRDAERADIEKLRISGRTRFNEFRRRFTFLTKFADIPAVSWELASPMELAGDYAHAVMDAVGPFELPDALPKPVVSKSFTAKNSKNYWLRFATPSAMNDTVYARVREPLNADNPPTLIFLHGIGVEFDHWQGMVDESARLVHAGFRVVRPEAPWHGRRVPDGYYGGEKFIATMPRGMFEYSAAQVKEVAVLMDWCRANSHGPVVLGGSSLGAHMARIAAGHATDWPARLHPDALFLIAPGGKLEDAAMEGSVANIWGSREAAIELGWSTVLQSKWLALVEPNHAPVVAPERIVTVVAARSAAEQAENGSKLVQQLQVPDTNVFKWPLGQFSVPINMIRNQAPLQRLQSVLAES